MNGSGWTIAGAAEGLGCRRLPPRVVEQERDRLERALGRRLPESVVELLSFEGLTVRVAQAYSSQVIFPSRLEMLEDPPDHLVLFRENQGVCDWSVSLVDGDPPVVATGDLACADAATTYAPDVATLVGAWAWDLTLLETTPLLQAQAVELDEGALRWLRSTLRELPPTHAWPCRRNLRFESDAGARVALWDCTGQCDWWISSSEPETTERLARRLLDISDLRESLWSNDRAGIELLARITQV